MAEAVTDSGSPERVALEVARQIQGWEEANPGKDKAREYWITLFAQCMAATRGVHPSKILTN